MPRIRSLKPEHKAHRKTGPLDDRTYRLWIGMITEADDEGRLVAEPAQLRVLIFGYHPEVSVSDVEASLSTLDSLGLIHTYPQGGVQYAWFPSWKDHQRINRPTPSKLPPYTNSVNGHGALTDDSRRIGGDQGVEGSGSEGKGGESGGGKPNREIASALTGEEADTLEARKQRARDLLKEVESRMKSP